MFAKDIHIGQSYRVSTSYGRGRAMVTGPGRKNRMDGKFHFPVEFPDAVPGSKAGATVGSRDFVRLWTMEDQQMWEKARMEQSQVSVMETALIAADFAPDGIRYIQEKVLYLSFRGDTAERVVAALIESVGEQAPPKQLNK